MDIPSFLDLAEEEPPWWQARTVWNHRRSHDRVVRVTRLRQVRFVALEGHDKFFIVHRNERHDFSLPGPSEDDLGGSYHRINGRFQALA